MGNWLNASRKECGDSISYHVDWARVPDLCKGCIAEKKAARAKWREKSCACGNTIKYHEDWDRIPDLCKDCLAVKKAARAKWHEKSCDCGNIIKYHEDWSNPPSHCKECNEWLTKPCGAQDCPESIRYKCYWDRVPEYCRTCKSGERRITVHQRKDDGTVHEYEGRGYVNRQGAAVFNDGESSGKHSHAVYRPDGSLKGQRDEGHGQDWVNEPVDVSLENENSGERQRGIRKQNRYSTPYKDRRSGNHVHDFSRRDYRERSDLPGHFAVKPSEGSAGEYAERRNQRGK